MFGDKHEFGSCLGYVFQPDVWSWIQGDWGEDFWSTLKFNFWFGSSAVCGLVTFVVIAAVFG